MKRLACIALLFVAATYAHAAGNLIPLMGAGGKRPAAAPSYTGPGDVVSGATAWWGLRAYDSTKLTGSVDALDVCDTSTGLTCTTGIKILASGALDVATAAGTAACSSSCSVTKIYDQVGTNHMTCSGALIARCPVLTFNCIGSLPCMTSTGGNICLLSGSTITLALPYSFAATSVRTGSLTSISAALAGLIGAQNITLGYSSATDTGAALFGGGDTLTKGSTADSSWHSETLTANTGSTTLNVDATTQVTGTSPGTPGADTITMMCRGAGSAALTGSVVEGGVWNGTQFNNTQSQNMNANAKSYWGF